MFRILSKYRLQFDILAVLAWGFIAVDKIFFTEPTERKNLSLFFGIIAGLLVIVKISDVIEGLKKKKSNNF
jgi:hypothetical protein